MTLSIKDPVADELAREAVKTWGGTITQNVIAALEARVAQGKRLKARREQGVYEDIMEIAHSCASLPVYDDRTPDEILGYDENGLPH